MGQKTSLISKFQKNAVTSFFSRYDLKKEDLSSLIVNTFFRLGLFVEHIAIQDFGTGVHCTVVVLPSPSLFRKNDLHSRKSLTKNKIDNMEPLVKHKYAFDLLMKKGFHISFSVVRISFVSLFRLKKGCSVNFYDLSLAFRREKKAPRREARLAKLLRFSALAVCTSVPALAKGVKGLKAPYLGRKCLGSPGPGILPKIMKIVQDQKKEEEFQKALLLAKKYGKVAVVSKKRRWRKRKLPFLQIVRSSFSSRVRSTYAKRFYRKGLRWTLKGFSFKKQSKVLYSDFKLLALLFVFTPFKSLWMLRLFSKVFFTQKKGVRGGYFRPLSVFVLKL